MSRRALRSRIDLQRRVYERADACCATTGWAARSIVDDYGVDPEKVHVVGVGRNHSIDPPAAREWTTPRYLFVGWDWERKNGPAVVRAFAQVRAAVPGATLDLVGRHPRVNAPGVTDHGILRLTVPADRHRAERLYARATCFVMPSQCEPSALAYVEAAHAGLPSIGTTVGGAADLIGEGGCVVDPSDEDALLAAMLDLADPGRASAAGAAARLRSERFTWPLVAARLVHALGRPTEPPVAFL
jgi:glycosyltransferase involved in cell wall biosynthesis